MRDIESIARSVVPDDYYERDCGVTVAVGIYRKSIVTGLNSQKTSPAGVKLFRDGNVYSSIHAEDDLIPKLIWEDKFKVKIYVVRFRRKDRRMAMAKPCFHCERKLLYIGIMPKNIFYYSWDMKWERLSDAE